MSPNLARSIVRCYLSSCEILMSMQQKLQKMLHYLFLNREKRSNIRIANDEYVRGDTTFETGSFQANFYFNLIKEKCKYCR